MRMLLFATLAFAAACSSNPPSPTPTDAPTPAPASAPTDAPAPTALDAPIDTSFERPPYLDFAELVARYTGTQTEPLTDAELYRLVPLGHHETFTLLSPSEPPSTYEVETEVMYVGERAIWYVERGLGLSAEAVEGVGDWFERTAFDDAKVRIAPYVALPGPIAVIVADLRGGVAGYFTSLNALPVETWAHSAERVAIVIAPGQPFDGDGTRGVAIHELQHLLHWLVDPTESTWVHEGMSEWVVREQQIPSIPFWPYLRSPEVSLTRWPLEFGAALANYSGASLFMRYMLNILAPDGDASAFVRQQADGVEGVRDFMLQLGYDDYTFEQLYLDYATANVVGAPSGEYAAPGQSLARVPRIARAPASVSGTVPQWAPWYLRVDDGQSFRVTFAGNATVPVLPLEPRSGDYCWWSNAVDQGDAMLTRPFDLRSGAPAVLSFWHWYEIEHLWDWGYVSVSTDGGASWTALGADGTTANDPIGTSVGPGFTGRSDGWVRTEVDLGAYAGQRVHVRFEYVTDDGRNGAGWCIDDIALQGASDGAESAASPWQADGFVRLHRSGAPQRYAIRIVEGDPGAPIVRDVPLDGMQAVFRLNGPATLIVVGMTEVDAQPAEFLLRLERAAPASAA